MLPRLHASRESTPWVSARFCPSLAVLVLLGLWTYVYGLCLHLHQAFSPWELCLRPNLVFLQGYHSYWIMGIQYDFILIASAKTPISKFMFCSLGWAWLWCVLSGVGNVLQPSTVWYKWESPSCGWCEGFCPWAFMTLPSEIGQAQKGKLCVIPLIWGVCDHTVHRNTAWKRARGWKTELVVVS